MNVAAIGNLVPQLHIHHIARYTRDKAWPAPVWGKFPACAYTPAELAGQIDRLKPHLSTELFRFN
jgi:diadenosine tetraphosphate (Ap4A) HIT family hydrolase